MSVSPPPSRRARRSKKAAASALLGDDAVADLAADAAADADAGSLPGFERADEPPTISASTAGPIADDPRARAVGAEDPTGVLDEDADADAAAAALAFASVDDLDVPGLGPRNDEMPPDLVADERSLPGVGSTGGGSTDRPPGRREADAA